MGTPARVPSCQENLRWVKGVLNEMIGEFWNTSPRQEEKPQIQCGVYITLKRQITYGGQKGCMACCRHAGV